MRNKRITLCITATLALALPAWAASGDGAMRAAREALARGDGIAAEAALKQALGEGTPRSAVAAAMGEAELLQDDFVEAREWLASGEFAADQKLYGLHQLARLEMAEGNVTAAAEAFDKALEVGVGTAEMWVDIGRLRYRSAQHHLALEAAYNALKLDPENPRAIEFRGQLARDAQGLKTAAAWFAHGLKSNPNDIGLLGEYAATLGELGRANAMLKVTRRMIELGGGEERAFYLQAVLSARAGNDELARKLLWRSDETYRESAAGLVLAGVLDLRAGNSGLALESFDKLAQLQPDNLDAQLLLARGMFADGDYRGVIEDFATAAARTDASPYLLALVGRSYEFLGERGSAAPFLDRAARASSTAPSLLDLGEAGRMTLFRYAHDPLRIDVGVARVRELLAANDAGGAQAVLAEFTKQYPYSADIEVLAGDVALANGNAAEAVVQYRKAAQIRRSLALVERTVASYRALGRESEAEAEVLNYLSEHPMDGGAARLAADFAMRKAEWRRAQVLLAHARAAGGGERDPQLLADLSRAALEAGDTATAKEAAQAAFALQRSNGRAAYALALTLRAAGDERGARALFAKARQLGAASQPALATR
jgi:lipopolysaccharide biosynthesis regulator YciM